MYDMIRPLWAEIDLDILMENMRQIRKLVGDVRIVTVIKADGYGHGAPEIARYMLEAGADEIAVAVVTEAMQLRACGITAPITILSFTPLDFAEVAVREGFALACYSLSYAVELDKIAGSLGMKARLNIISDTGMGRLGFPVSPESADEVASIAKLENIEMYSLQSHFASADSGDKTYANFQLERFKAFMKSMEDKGVAFKYTAMSNSAGVIDIPEARFNCVRPGIMQYGYYPSDEVNRTVIDVRPVMSVKSMVVLLKTVPAGTSIGYGSTFTAEKETKVATIPIGYADGYFRNLSNKGEVLIGGRRCRVLGRVCMDHIMVDASACDGVREGDEAVLMGSQGKESIWADEIAQKAGTISYEIICAVAKRVPRVYLKDGREAFRTEHLECLPKGAL